MRPSSHRAALRISIAYALAAAAWILFSDALVNLAFPDALAARQVQTLKGWAFVAATSVLLYAGWRRAHRSLVESELRYRTLIETSPDGIGMSDLGGKFLLVNARTAMLHGYDSPDDLIGVDSLSLVAPEDRQRVVEGAQRALAAGEMGHFEYTLLRRDGSRFPAESHAAAVLDAHGAPQAFVTVMRDVTDRKRAELREAQLGRILDESLNEIYIFDADDLRFLEVNHGARRNLGYTLDELRRMTPIDVKPEYTLDTFAERLRPLREGAQSQIRFETVHRRRDGSRYPVEVRLQLMAYDDQRAFVAVILDITERREAEEALRESGERLRLAVSAANVGLWDWDLRTNQVYYSPEWKHQIGYDDHEITDDFSEWQSRVHPDDLERALQTVRAYVARPWPDFRNEFRFRHKDGSYRFILTQASLLYDDDGTPARMLGSHVDITEQKHAEEALKEREALLAETGKMAKVGGWELDPRTLKGTWTAEVARIHDLDPAQEATVDIGLSFYHGEHRKKIERALREATELGKPFDLELEMVSNKGVRKWIRTIGHPIKDGDRVVKVRGSFQDITDRRRTEQALRESEALLRAMIENLPFDFWSADVDGRVLHQNARSMRVWGDLVGQRLTELKVDEAILPGWLRNSRRALAGETVMEETEVVVGGDQRVHFKILAPILDRDVVRGVIGATLDITERKQAEEERDTALFDLQRRAKELEALHRSGQRLQQLRAPDSLAVEIIWILEELLDYQYGAVLLIDEPSGRLLPFALSAQNQGADFVQQDMAYVASHDLQLGVGITGWVAQTGHSALVGDVRDDPRYFSMRQDIRSELCVPLKVRDRIIGVVNVETHVPDAYTPADQRVLETVASQIAVAVHNTQLFQSVDRQRDEIRSLSARLAEIEEAERRQLARELHDRVGQNLTALSINLNFARAQLSELSAASVGERLDDALALVEETAERIRDVMAELRPPVLDDYGLAAALRWYAEQFAQRSGVSATFENGDQAGRLPAAVETALFRIAQEALTNVAKHAQASRVAVRLEHAADAARLTVADDGAGMDVSAPRAGWGMAIMHERAISIGGSLRVESQTGQGTRVVIEVPWDGGAIGRKASVDT